MPVEIHQILRSKRKTIALIIQKDGTLLVRAPRWVSGKAIREFAEKHSGWIRDKQAQVRAALPPPAKQYISGENFPFLGREYPLEIVKEQKPALVLDTRFNLAESAQGNAEQAFQLWYREQATEIITWRVHWFADRHNLQYQKIRISSARTRWGSCSLKGALSFSWRLILMPMEMVDYVVVHELVHTLFHNHSKRFWDQVEQILPDYRERRKWLRTNGQKEML
jgi:predicted metal-dependent hydrolase